MLQKSIKVFAQADRAFGIGLQKNKKKHGRLIDMNVFRTQGIILRTNEAVNWQKTKRSQPQLKIYWFF